MRKNAMRIYRTSFSNCHFIHIPAIEHGFYTEAIWVFAYTTPRRGKPKPLPLHALNVDPRTYAVDIALIEPRPPGKQRTWRHRQRLLPIKNVTIEIHGDSPVSQPKPRKPSDRKPRRAKAAEPVLCTVIANGRIVGDHLTLHACAADEFAHLPIERHRWSLYGETEAITRMAKALAPSFVSQDYVFWEFRSPSLPRMARYYARIHDLLQEDVDPGRTATLAILLWIRTYARVTPVEISAPHTY